MSDAKFDVGVMLILAPAQQRENIILMIREDDVTFVVHFDDNVIRVMLGAELQVDDPVNAELENQ